MSQENKSNRQSTIYRPACSEGRKNKAKNVDIT